MAQPVNEKEIRVVGLSRSGNHAVIDWIRGAAPGRVCFLNCCEGKQNPYRSARMLPGGDVAEANDSGFSIDKERRGEFSHKDLLIFNHEDSFLAHACSDVYEQHHDEWVGASRERIDLLILRDPFNLFASRFRRRGQIVKPAAALRIWKQHARQFTDGPTRLPQRPVLLSYNRWIASGEYRAEAAAQLGVEPDESALDRVPGCFGGSSFDGVAMDGRARAMRLLERWRHFEHDPAFRAFFDAQTVDLSDEIFGEIPGVAAWLGEDRAAGRRAG